MLDGLIVVLLFGLSGLVVAIELSVIATGRGHWDAATSRPEATVRLAQQLVRRPKPLLLSVRLLTLWFGTFGVLWAGRQFADSLAAALPAGVGTLNAVPLIVLSFLLAALVVVAREILPRPLAARYGRSLTRFGVRPLAGVVWVFRPVVLVLSGFAWLVLRVLGCRGETPTVSLEDIEGLIRAIAGEGLVDATEGRVALAALRLGDRTARDVMRPRTEVDALEIGTPIEEAFGMMAISIYTRFPVYEDHLDHIQGYVHVKDVMKQYFLKLPTPLRQMTREVVFVPESLPLDRLLVALQEKRSHLAVVLDEFGGTLGVVGPQDILNALVGEFRPDHLASPESDLEPIRAEGADRWLVAGSVPLESLVVPLGIAMPEGQRRSLSMGGLIQSELDRVPHVGDRLDWQGWRFEVVRMDPQKPRKVDRVRAIRLPTAPAYPPEGVTP